jgi:NADPH-dependent curcumin reductase CurA
MVSVTNARVIFNSRPNGQYQVMEAVIPNFVLTILTGFPEPGKTTITDRSETIDLESVPLNGGVLVKAVAISVDPYMRLLMREGPSSPTPGEVSIMRLMISSKLETDQMTQPPNWVVGQP